MSHETCEHCDKPLRLCACTEDFDGPRYIGPTECAFCCGPLSDPEEEGPLLRDAAREVADMQTLLLWRNNPPSIVAYGAPFKRSRGIRIESDARGRVLLYMLAVCTTGRPGDTENAPEEAKWFEANTDEGALHKAAQWVRKQAATTTEGLK